MKPRVKNIRVVPAMIIGVSLTLAGCAAGDSADNLTEAIEADSLETLDVVDHEEEGHTEPFPFLPDLTFLTLTDCEEALRESLFDVFGLEPTTTGLGADGSGYITQQEAFVAEGPEEAARIFGVFDEFVGQGQCLFDSGDGAFGETVNRSALTGLPGGFQGIRWETRYTDARPESCEEYVERREFWLVQGLDRLHFTAGSWSGCSVDSEFPNEISWEELQEQTEDAGTAMIGRL